MFHTMKTSLLCMVFDCMLITIEFFRLSIYVIIPFIYTYYHYHVYKWKNRSKAKGCQLRPGLTSKYILYSFPPTPSIKGRPPSSRPKPFKSQKNVRQQIFENTWCGYGRGYVSESNICSLQKCIQKLQLISCVCNSLQSPALEDMELKTIKSYSLSTLLSISGKVYCLSRELCPICASRYWKVFSNFFHGLRRVSEAGKIRLVFVMWKGR